MFGSLLFYSISLLHATPTDGITESKRSNTATNSDGAVIIKLGGEVTSADSPAQSLPVSAPISLDVVHMDIAEVIRIFATHSGQNILLGEGIQGTVTARVTNVPWTLALQSIAQSNGWTVTTIGEILLIEPIGTSK